MPIISRVEAGTRRGRLVHALIFAVLTLGGITMLYPFAIMVSGSLRSEMDETDLDLIPGYFFDGEVLYRKFLETKYYQNVSKRNQSHLAPDFSFRTVSAPGEIRDRKVEDFRRFFAESEWPRHWQILGGTIGIRTTPENLRELRNRVAAKFDGDFEAFNRAVGAGVPSWQGLLLPAVQWETQRYDFVDNALYETYFEMLEEAPLAERIPVPVTGYFLETMIFPVYGQVEPGAFNAAHEGEPLGSYRDFALPRSVPGVEEPTLRREWIEFVREELNPSFVLLEGVEDEAFREHLRKAYGTVEDLNLAWGTEVRDFSQLRLPVGEWLRGAPRGDYLSFLLEQQPETYRLAGPEFAWRDWLRREYGEIGKLNEVYGTDYASFAEVHMPLAELEKRFVEANSGRLRWTYATRNYVNVIDELFLRGRAFLNTLIFCALSVALALLVNPLTAYALSRFQLPGSYKILLLLMATMAFPPMVTLIPTFIILQNLNLMNTFAALVLPTIANGYLIFLLKGFFDSLPRELYQAAMIDGASEFRIFFQITMSLSKPILAVVALMAFNSSYTMFLYPLLVAPRQDMWLLSVWLYQYQQTASMAGVFASVLIASLPTLLVFIFAQNVIMRGIVVPTEK